MNNYFLYSKDGTPRLLMNPRMAATIIGDGHGSWTTLTNGAVAYVMRRSRSLSTNAGKMNIYLHAGDYLLETTEPTW